MSDQSMTVRKLLLYHLFNGMLAILIATIIVGNVAHIMERHYDGYYLNN